MTFKKLLQFGFMLAIFEVAIKILFYRSFDWGSVTLPHYLFWGISIIFGIAFIRRMGVITYLEALVVCGVWIFIWLVLDLFTAAGLLGYGIFLDFAFLLNYLFVILAMFMFHNKRHVETRRQLAQQK